MKYKIGSFNMKNFGAYPKRDFEKIAEIIRGENLDVVAFQEILSEGKGLERYVNDQFYKWEYCWASPNGTADISKMGEIITNDSRGEGYAYIWNKRKFKLAESGRLGKEDHFEPRIINSLSNDVNVNCRMFARAPYYIRLQPCYGGFFELRLLNIHIYFGDNTLSEVQKRVIEYNTLVQEIYPRISQRRYGNFRVPYTIAMGDYNLNIFRVESPTQSRHYLPEVYNYNGKRESYQVITAQDQLSTLSDKGYANNYDHFTYSRELSPFSNISCYAVDAVTKYCGGDFEYYNANISDHVPVIIEVEI